MKRKARHIAVWFPDFLPLAVPKNFAANRAGRILNHREPNAVDLEAVFAACAANGTAIETNGLPDRIDLSSELVREAIRAGVRITCSTDAHSVRGLSNMQLSVATARRGWATSADVLNTRGLDELLAQKR